jgi:UDPglucose 6-dehydrogenase
MNVSIVGTGYVGLVTGVCLADKGHKVTCVDKDELRVKRIQNLDVPFFEKDLKNLIEKNLDKQFFITTDLYLTIINSDITIMAVGTPFGQNQIDLSFIKEASEQIGEALRSKKDHQHFIVIKSTVPPGTTENFITPIVKNRLSEDPIFDVQVGVNPEFLSEGQAVADFLFPDRLVIGGNSEKFFKKIDELYSFLPHTPRVQTNSTTAEMIKYTSNAMLAASISFTNEIANLCFELPNVDVVDVMKGVHLSHYLRPVSSTGESIQAPISSFFKAGCGYGGSCLPKDTRGLVAFAKEKHVEMPLLSSVIKINDCQPRKMLEILRNSFRSLCNLRVLVLGLSYKPDTNDVRESPAIEIIRALSLEKSIISVYDPVAMDEARKNLKDIDVHYFYSLTEALKDAQAILIVTSWKEFEILPSLLDGTKKQPLIVDGRRMLNKSSVKRYSGIGISPNLIL